MKFYHYKNNGNISQTNKSRSISGFTLVELLVVISIIALLLAILMPSLRAARAQAQRVVCLSNAKSLYSMQFIYTSDNKGIFPYHQDTSAEFVQNSTLTQSFKKCMASYITNSDILRCPLLASEIGYWHKDTKWVGWGDSAGGWDGKIANGSYPLWTLTSYAFFGGYDPSIYVATLDFSRFNEPVWPKKSNELNSRQTLITHRVTEYPNFYDMGHGSRVFRWTVSPNSRPFAKDVPVVKGDGSASSISNSQMERRVSDTGVGIWWY